MPYQCKYCQYPVAHALGAENGTYDLVHDDDGTQYHDHAAVEGKFIDPSKPHLTDWTDDELDDHDAYLTRIAHEAGGVIFGIPHKEGGTYRYDTQLSLEDIDVLQKHYVEKAKSAGEQGRNLEAYRMYDDSISRLYYLADDLVVSGNAAIVNEVLESVKSVTRPPGVFVSEEVLGLELIAPLVTNPQTYY